MAFTWDSGAFAGVLKEEKTYTIGSNPITDSNVSTLSAMDSGETADSSLDPNTRSLVARAQADMRTLATAIESYRVDYNTYPRKLIPHVTTPVAYISRVPKDPFSEDRADAYRYKRIGKTGWILWSIGPDQFDDEAEVEFDPKSDSNFKGDLIRTNRGGTSYVASPRRTRRQPPQAPTPRKVDLSSKASVEAAISTVRADMRTLTTALESYQIDFNVYPDKIIPSLTTPIAYIRYIPIDLFSPNRDTPYRYKRDGKTGWILWSIGPDQVDDNAEAKGGFDPRKGFGAKGDLIRTNKGEKFTVASSSSSRRTRQRSNQAPQPSKVNLKSEASVRAAVSRAKSDMRTLATALEAYNIDYNVYAKTTLSVLTTPIAYILHVPIDPFSLNRDTPYRYRRNSGKIGWVLWSVGPDGTNGNAVIPFDSTNGTVSKGDIIRRSMR